MPGDHNAEAMRRDRAEALRAACIQAVVQAYEDAGMSGLCAEGRFELAVDALRALDFERFLRESAAAHGPDA